MKDSSDRYFLKIREVRSRFYGHASTFEAQIVRRHVRPMPLEPLWSVVGRSRGHADSESAKRGGTALAARRGWAIETDPRKVRQAEFKDRYGED